jgi:hypothetical protein
MRNPTKSSALAAMAYITVVGIGIPVLLMAAAPDPIEQNQVGRASELGPVAMNAAEALRTFEISIRGRTEVTVYIAYTDLTGGAATSITLTCVAGPEGDVNYPTVKLEDDATSGQSNAFPHVWNFPFSGSPAYARAVVSPLNDEKLKCIIGGGGTPNANDQIDSVKTRLGVL